MCEVITVEYILWCKKNDQTQKYDRAVLKSLYGGMYGGM